MTGKNPPGQEERQCVRGRKPGQASGPTDPKVADQTLDLGGQTKPGGGARQNRRTADEARKKNHVSRTERRKDGARERERGGGSRVRGRERE